MISSVTTIGLSHFQNSLLPARKTEILGLQVGSGGVPPSTMADLLEVTAMAGTAHPAFYIPASEILPVQGIGDDDWYIEYGFLLDIEAVGGASVTFNEEAIWAVDFAPVYDWSNTTDYTTLDYVRYNGNAYQCILANTNKLPTNATYWTLVSSPVWHPSVSYWLQASEPYILWYASRSDAPLTVYDTHTISRKVRIGLTRGIAVSDKIQVDPTDLGGYVETQVAFIAEIVAQNAQIRDLATQIESLK